MTLHYTRPLPGGNTWSTSVIWGCNHKTPGDPDLNSYLVETLFPVSPKNLLTGRFHVWTECVDKDELFAGGLAHQLADTFRIEAYTAGYTRAVGSFKYLETGVGVNITGYTLPAALKPYYGDHPWGANLYVRFRLKPPERHK